MTKPCYSPAQLRAHQALLHAAQQVGANNYRLSSKMTPYTVSSVHAMLVQYSSDVLKGDLTVNDAMAFVTSYDVMKERFPQRDK